MFKESIISQYLSSASIKKQSISHQLYEFYNVHSDLSIGLKSGREGGVKAEARQFLIYNMTLGKESFI